MPWNLDSDRPIYLQLMERIQHDIISGTYKPGDKLPSVRELAMEASVNLTQCKKHFPNWRELVWYTPAVQADDLLRRTKQ